MPEFLSFPIRSTKLSMSVEVKAHVAQRQTDFQRIDVYDTEAFGKVLFLDGHVQLAELDEAGYHEALVHIPLLSVPNPTRALVVGGGDGGVLRELCRHKNLETIDMVEIDQGVIEVSREFLPTLSARAFDDPRVNLHIEDAFAFIKRVNDPYDLIIMDVTDVYEEEDGALSEQLFTATFHADCRAALKPHGMLVTQADNHIFCPYSREGILKDFSATFPRTGSYQALVPSFGGYSAYAWASVEGSVASECPTIPFEIRYLNPVTWALAMQRLPFDQG